VSSDIHAMRGAIELKVLVLIIVLSAAGIVWVQMRQHQSGGQARLFRYKDERGKIVYTDSLESVPESQRQDALSDKDLPQITKADYDSYLEAFHGRKQEEKGFLASLKELFDSQPSEPEDKRVSAGSARSQPSSKKSEGPDSSPEVLKGISDVQKTVTNSFTAIGKELGGGN
jgi:hypothetical protein